MLGLLLTFIVGSLFIFLMSKVLYEIIYRATKRAIFELLEKNIKEIKENEKNIN